MIFHEKDAQKFTIPGGTAGMLYPSSPQKDHTIAMVTMDGVYPEKGFSVNDICTETLFVIEGSLTVVLDEQVHVVGKNDVIVILPGVKYHIEGNGRVLDLITPQWDSAQNHIVEK